MPDDDPKPPPRSKGLGTDQWEKVERLRSDAIGDERKDNEKAVERLEKALVGRAEAAERSAHLWFRLAVAMLGILSMLVAGTAAVGAGVSIPGLGEFTVNKAAKPERAAPAVEATNEGAEAADDAGGLP